jgi:superfamily I DNA/RNA helicase
VEGRVSRGGMRQPLSAAQRAQVWDIRDQVAAAMDEKGTFSKNYSRLKLIERLEAEAARGSGAPGAPRLADVEVAFVDESQDLTAADLKALKLMSARGVVMAGDAGQAIYGLGSPYRRAGIDISGRSRILRTDFRTTCPIHDLAEKYRQVSGPDIEGDTVVTHAFREGPAPELYAARTREELMGLVVEKAGLFIDKLGYDPENITILAPGKADVAAIRERLSRRGIPSADIRDDSFSFATEGLARVSTMHSSKGLDFPVVLLYLPGLPLSAEYDESAAGSLARNLIYVSMTRAMDNLNVFVMEEAKEPAIADLVRLCARQA